MRVEIGTNSKDKALEPLERIERAADVMETLSSSVARLAGGLTRDGVLASELLTLEQDTSQPAGAGVRQHDSHVPHASVAIFNLGTCTITAANVGRGNGLPGQGRGVTKVRAGAFVCLPLAGQSISLHGRTGEQVVLVRYSRPVPPAMGTGPAPYHTVNLAGLSLGNSVAQYTTPWGDLAEYGGLSVRDTAGPAGATDASEFLVLDGAGNILETITLAGAESTSDELANGKVASGATISVQLVKGSVTGSLLVR